MNIPVPAGRNLSVRATFQGTAGQFKVVVPSKNEFSKKYEYSKNEVQDEILVQ